MTENKRFKVVQGYNDRYCQDTATNKLLNQNQTVEYLNNLCEENEQLKQAYTQLKHRHSLLYDVCIDAECDRDSLKKDVDSLEKENEQLKQQIEDLEFNLQEVRKMVMWNE